ncbi:DUF4124 domain-containing protein [uncultured Umboniibacter sp.]|uniref:DUF4124 domain-containing protein n=1 Tax=uncultured Umboniibacter sp. TaxID=1798917 RepID=UPI002630708A|nr:DUF4124 domain-containing protein [uncultured Umboniibacter sp.]
MIRAWYLLLIVTFCTVSVATASADVYKYRDANGNVVYSDTPVEGAERVDVVVHNPATPGESTTAIDSPTNDPHGSPSDEPVAYNLAITSPAHDSTVPMGQETLSVNLALTPSAPVDTTYRLLANGTPIAQGNQTNFVLEQLYRGELVLTAEAIDTEGNVLATAIAVTVHVKRASRRITTLPTNGM